MKPTLKKDWERQRDLFNTPALRKRLRSEAKVIEDNSRFVLEHLYQPDAETGYVFCGQGTPEMEALAKEPVTWGDLDVVDVNRLVRGDWVVMLVEAAPDACPVLCAYIQGWLEVWGWPNVRVQTEW